MLNRHPEVKRFIFEDIPQYEAVTFKEVPGAAPEILFFDEDENEVEKLKLEDYNQEACNKLLHDYGFRKKVPSDHPEL